MTHIQGVVHIDGIRLIQLLGLADLGVIVNNTAALGWGSRVLALMKIRLAEQGLGLLLNYGKLKFILPIYLGETADHLLIQS